ncbi:hypothetical protein B0H13DRAFT_2325919 [Mycena leptocephala]|nr:hypothetical protein B0H13DRAFT_2325919 [Mycena leptocephala]
MSQTFDQTKPVLLLLHLLVVDNLRATMMLVQKQPIFSMNLAQSPYIHQHRRHPSAPHPIVQVQPTRTPGLLSLSKPQRTPKTDHKSSPRPKQQQQPASRSPRPTPAESAAPHAPEVRGRNQGKRPQQQRSASHAAPARRRQPSPDPAPTTTTATAPVAPPPNKRRHPNPAASTPIPVPSLPSAVTPQRTSTLDRRLRGTSSPCATTPSTPTLPPVRRPPRRLLRPSAAPARTAPQRAAHPHPSLSAARAPEDRPALVRLPGAFPFPTHASPAHAANANHGGSSTTPSPHSSPKRRADRRAKHLSEGVVLPPLFPFQFGTEARRSRSSERDGAQAQGMSGPQTQAQTLFASSCSRTRPAPRSCRRLFSLERFIALYYYYFYRILRNTSHGTLVPDTRPRLEFNSNEPNRSLRLFPFRLFFADSLCSCSPQRLVITAPSPLLPLPPPTSPPSGPDDDDDSSNLAPPSLRPPGTITFITMCPGCRCTPRLASFWNAAIFCVTYPYPRLPTPLARLPRPGCLPTLTTSSSPRPSSSGGRAIPLPLFIGGLARHRHSHWSGAIFQVLAPADQDDDAAHETTSFAKTKTTTARLAVAAPTMTTRPDVLARTNLTLNLVPPPTHPHTL